MQEVATFSSFAATVGLILWRPHIGPRLRVNPAAAAAMGVLLMLIVGSVHVADIGHSAGTLWRPFVAIASIMVTTAAAQRVGVLDRLADAIPSVSASRMFAGVFALSAATSAVLNNDAAVLLLTPVVVLLVRRTFPDEPGLMVPFAFAVFMAAGVAPLVVSNPMNMIVAGYADLDFNAYALRMLPISIAGWLVSFAVLRAVFRRQLGAAPLPAESTRTTEPWGRSQRQVIASLIGVLAAYPIVSYAGGPVWVVAASGALVATALVAHHHGLRGVGSALSGVSWETLAFLLGVFILALGLRNAGIVGWLADLYSGVHLAAVGTVSAAGSALINNHPMALINMLAIPTDGSGNHRLLAALIGGDLGPRLLPMGSLAGLLWLASLRRLQVDIPLKTFVRVGVTVTLPSLAVALLILSLYP